MAKSNPSVQKRRRELKKQEHREEKANRRAERMEAKKLRAETIACGDDPDRSAVATPEGDKPSTAD